MRKLPVYLFFILVVTAQWSLFAGGQKQNLARQAVHADVGLSMDFDSSLDALYAGAGYEYALGNYFSIGAYADTLFGPIIYGEGYYSAFNFLARPRFYFGNALEKFFIGANLGYSFSDYQNDRDNKRGSYEGPVAGLNVGYKFVLGNGSGFMLEPSLRVDIIPLRAYAGISLGYAWRSRERPPQAVKPGIYVGIITFGPEAEDITGGGPIYLDSQGLANLNNLLDTRYYAEDKIGTALFYAAHLGLANMKRAESKLPQDLQSVTMFTFTDGLDVSSTGLSLPGINDPGNTGRVQFAGGTITPYQEFVKSEIDTRRINGTNISAYVAAVKGDDVTNETAFNSALQSLASAGQRYTPQVGSNISALQGLFNDIAQSVIQDLTTRAFTMITPEYPLGTRVRMTFDGETTAQQAQDARRYIEGELTIENRQYILTNVSYGGGISSSEGVRIREATDRDRDKGRISFVFHEFSGYNLSVSQTVLERELKQWHMDAEDNEWQINSEYVPGREINEYVVKNSALVYLILDKSMSINSKLPDNINRIRDYSKAFINSLYNAYYY